MKTVNIIGMGCEHCVRAVTQALENEGLTNVTVDLAAGTASFAGEIGADRLRAVLDDAGYELGE